MAKRIVISMIILALIILGHSCSNDTIEELMVKSTEAINEYAAALEDAKTADDVKVAVKRYIRNTKVLQKKILDFAKSNPDKYALPQANKEIESAHTTAKKRLNKIMRSNKVKTFFKNTDIKKLLKPSTSGWQ